MGQKVHPIGMRVGIIRDWDAKWYAEKEYADYLHEDLAIRKFIQKELADAAVSTIEIERAVNKVNVSLHTAKPGMVIGKGGANVDALRAALNKLTGKQVHINIIEIKRPDLDAHLVGEGIARQLEQRVAFRRAQKQAIQRAMRAGAKGIKTQVSGRLNGADIARAEGYSEGTVPLHTLRADIDYAWEEADTTYGKLDGSAQRVPTPTGSTTILVAVVKGKDVTVEGINAAMKAAATESFGYNEDQIVSSDIIGMRFGSLFDATQTMVSKIDDDTYQVQVVSWYDNENSYTSQMVRTIKYFANVK